MNPKLIHMNTQRIQKLEAGEAFELPGSDASTAVLTEGELSCKAPAQWLADTVFIPPPQRLTAPALVPPGARSLVALRPGAIAITQASPHTLLKARRTALTWLRVALRNPLGWGR